ncbi:MAG: hypothetical protein WCQ95_06065 [Bacteroidota bacterium]
MQNKISYVVTPTNITNLEAIQGVINTELPCLVSLTNADRRKIRKMGTKHTGYVADVYVATKSNTSLLPGSFDFAEFTKDMELMDKLSYLKTIFMKIIEQFSDTEILLGHELMKQADFCYSILKLSAKDNASVKLVVDQIAQAYLGQGRYKSATQFNFGPDDITTINHVVVGSTFVNNGSTIVKFKAGPDLALRPRLLAPITVNPGNSAPIPKGWISIEVTNLSSTMDGSFMVKIK